MKREDFLKTCGLACAGTIVLPSILQSCKTAAYIPYTTLEKQLVVRKADVVDKTMSLLRIDKLPAPVCLISENDEYHALLLQCTHKQCEVSPYGKVFYCPCHGSEFDRTGAVLQGPAEKPLTKFIVTSDAENIYIR